MDFNEFPLLDEQNLTMLLLRLAEHGPTTLADGLRRLRTDLDIAGVSPPVSDAEILDHLVEIRSRLTIARLVEPAGTDRFRLTARGHQVLAEHPTGVDGSVLMQFPEFRAHIEEAARPRGSDDPDLKE